MVSRSGRQIQEGIPRINGPPPLAESLMPLLLALNNPKHEPIVQLSLGIHITFPNCYSPRTIGCWTPRP